MNVRDPWTHFRSAGAAPGMVSRFVLSNRGTAPSHAPPSGVQPRPYVILVVCTLIALPTAKSAEYYPSEQDAGQYDSAVPNTAEPVPDQPQANIDSAERDSQRKKPFELRAKRDQVIERPYWIPAHAYAVTDDTTHYRWVIGPITIEKRLPNHPTTTRLSRSTSKYWRGYLPRPCFVRILPDRSAPEGNFIFFTVGHKNGPRGWLQYAGLDQKGRPHYRYWFDSL